MRSAFGKKKPAVRSESTRSHGSGWRLVAKLFHARSSRPTRMAQALRSIIQPSAPLRTS